MFASCRAIYNVLGAVGIVAPIIAAVSAVGTTLILLEVFLVLWISSFTLGILYVPKIIVLFSHDAEAHFSEASGAREMSGGFSFLSVSLMAREILCRYVIALETQLKNAKIRLSAFGTENSTSSTLISQQDRTREREKDIMSKQNNSFLSDNHNNQNNIYNRNTINRPQLNKNSGTSGGSFIKNDKRDSNGLYKIGTAQIRIGNPTPSLPQLQDSFSTLPETGHNDALFDKNVATPTATATATVAPAPPTTVPTPVLRSTPPSSTPPRLPRITLNSPSADTYGTPITTGTIGSNMFNFNMPRLAMVPPLAATTAPVAVTTITTNDNSSTLI